MKYLYDIDGLVSLVVEWSGVLTDEVETQYLSTMNLRSGIL